MKKSLTIYFKVNETQATSPMSSSSRRTVSTAVGVSRQSMVDRCSGIVRFSSTSSDSKLRRNGKKRASASEATSRASSVEPGWKVVIKGRWVNGYGQVVCNPIESRSKNYATKDQCFALAYSVFNLDICTSLFWLEILNVQTCGQDACPSLHSPLPNENLGLVWIGLEFRLDVFSSDTWYPPDLM